MLYCCISNFAYIVAPVLYCYVCDDCPERKLEPLRHMAACPDEAHVSCIATLTTFGEHKSQFIGLLWCCPDVVYISAISRGCSRAPAVSSRGRSYNKYNGAVCSQHVVNIMRVSLWATDCNISHCQPSGHSLPLPQGHLQRAQPAAQGDDRAEPRDHRHWRGGEEPAGGAGAAGDAAGASEQWGRQDGSDELSDRPALLSPLLIGDRREL